MNRYWLVPAFIIVACEILVASMIGPLGSVPFGTYLVVGVTIGVGGLCLALPVHLLALYQKGVEHPFRPLLARLPWAFVLGCTLVGAQIAILNWTKVLMPQTVGFWADVMFANWDLAIFGEDPWRLSYAVLGAARWLDPVYASWGAAKFAVLLLVLAMPASDRKAQALIAYFALMALGALGQYFGASAGPLFYQRLGLGDRFVDLPVRPLVALASEYLWRDYLSSGGRIGTGISAMPSMHVAMAMWIALVVRSIRPRLQIIGWVYFTAILIGSVHLGWHYAVDGLVAIVLAVIAWNAARWMVQFSQALQAPSLTITGAPGPTRTDTSFETRF
jgi:hypothetical protein